MFTDPAYFDSHVDNASFLSNSIDSLSHSFLSSNGGDSRADDHEGSTVMALCTRGSRVGCAIYRSSDCVIDVFELTMLYTAYHLRQGHIRNDHCAGGDQTVSYVQDDVRDGLTQGQPSCSQRSEEAMPFSEADVPACLLWLVRFVDLHQPLVLLPDDSEDGDVAALAAGFFGRGSSHGMSHACRSHVIAAVLRHYDKQRHILRLNRTSAFNHQHAMPRLSSMYPDIAPATLAARFHPQHLAMLSAMAALLYYTASVQSNIVNVVERGPVSTLYVDPATLSALQVTRQERHPCDYQGRGRSKEGLSLFSMINYTTNPMGRTLLRQWLVLPSSDMHELTQRQTVVSFFVHPARQEALRRLRLALHEIRPCSSIFIRLRSGKASLIHYRTLLRTLCGMDAVVRLLAPLAMHRVSFLQTVVDSVLVHELQRMAGLLVHTVHGVGRGCASSILGADTCTRTPCDARAAYGGAACWEDGNVGSTDGGQGPDTRETRRGRAITIRPGADPTAVLDELRASLLDLGATLRHKAQEAFAELSAAMRSTLCLRCVFASPHGYLLCTDEACLGKAAEALGVGQERRASVSSAAMGHADVETHVVGPIERVDEDELCEDYSGQQCGADVEEQENEAEMRVGGGGAYSVDADVRMSPSSSPATSSASASAYSSSRVSVSSSAVARTEGCVASVLTHLRHGYGWELHYTDDGMYYFKNACMRELDAVVGDLRQRIQIREDELRREMNACLLYGSLAVLSPARVLAELDCLLSFAHCAVRHGWSRPTLLQPGRLAELRIHHGWHPILGRMGGEQGCATGLTQRACAESSVCGGCVRESEYDGERRRNAVVRRSCYGMQATEESQNAADVQAERDGGAEAAHVRFMSPHVQTFSLSLGTSSHTAAPRVHVFYGANGSGKSVLLGAVAHILLLAHMGSFVPAASVTMSLFGSLWAVTPAHVVLSSELDYLAAAAAAGSCSGLGSGSSAAAATMPTSSFQAECAMLQRALRCCMANAAAAETVLRGVPSAYLLAKENRDGDANDVSAWPSEALLSSLPAAAQGALHSCTSVIVLDEFGCGTAPEDGRALLESVLRWCARDDLADAEERRDGGGGGRSGGSAGAHAACEWERGEHDDVHARSEEDRVLCSRLGETRTPSHVQLEPSPRHVSSRLRASSLLPPHHSQDDDDDENYESDQRRRDVCARRVSRLTWKLVRPLVLCATHFVEMFAYVDRGLPRGGELCVRVGSGDEDMGRASGEARRGGGADEATEDDVMDRISFYEMRCVPVFAVRQPCPHAVVGCAKDRVCAGGWDEAAYAAAAEAVCDGDRRGETDDACAGGQPVLMDIIPTFEPCPIRLRRGGHAYPSDDHAEGAGVAQVDLIAFQDRFIEAGLALGRRCHLEDTLMQLWQRALQIIQPT